MIWSIFDKLRVVLNGENAFIDRVFDAYIYRSEHHLSYYCQIYKTDCQDSSLKFCGINALLHCGAAALNSKQLEVICKRIVDHGLAHPNWMQEVLPNEKLHEFLTWYASHDSYISTGPYLAIAIWNFKRKRRWFGP